MATTNKHTTPLAGFTTKWRGWLSSWIHSTQTCRICPRFCRVAQLCHWWGQMGRENKQAVNEDGDSNDDLDSDNDLDMRWDQCWGLWWQDQHQGGSHLPQHQQQLLWLVEGSPLLGVGYHPSYCCRGRSIDWFLAHPPACNHASRFNCWHLLCAEKQVMTPHQKCSWEGQHQQLYELESPLM